MPVGSIHIDPTVLAHQGLGRAEALGRAPHGHGHGPASGHAFAAVMAQHAAATAPPSAHHMAQVRAAQARPAGRHRHGVDAEHFRADDAAYAEAMHVALGHGRPTRPAHVGQAQSLVMASLSMMNVHYEPTKDDDEE